MDARTLALTLRKDLADGFRLGIPKYCPEQIFEVMESCWNAVPEERPTFSSIKRKFEIYYHFDRNTEDHADDDNSEDLLDMGHYESSKAIDYPKQSINSEVQIQYAQLIHHKENLRKQFDAIDR